LKVYRIDRSINNYGQRKWRPLCVMSLLSIQI